MQITCLHAQKDYIISHRIKGKNYETECIDG